MLIKLMFVSNADKPVNLISVSKADNPYVCSNADSPDVCF